MRRFLTTSLIILALAISAAGATPAAHAIGTSQEGAVCDPQVNDCAANLSCLPATNGLIGYTCQSGATTNIGTVDPAQRTPTDEAKSKEASWSLNFVVSWIVKLFAWLVGVAAVTLNYAMYYTVVGMGAYVKNLTAVGLVWTVLRDIGNILLIFGFLAIGISIIIDSEWYGGGQKLLPTLLIVAVFANFSLFAAEAMVDVGNLFATQIYKQISGGSLPASGAFGAASDVANERISTLILNKVGLQTIYFGGNGKINTDVFEAGNSWLISFMSIILFVIVAFVMFALAFILISRFIVLILLIMVSPVGFAGLAVPGLQGWANKWWHTLFQQTITAPILLLLLYIALRVITDDAFLTGFGAGKDSIGWIGWVKTTTGTNNLGGLAAMMLSFLVAMGLLLAVVYFAKTLSAVGAGWATKTAGKLSFGATAFVGRRTIGRASNYTARKIRSSSLGRSETGRLLAGLADRGAKASYDVRGTSALKNIPGGGIDAGAAQKGGYRGTEDSAIKAREDYAKSLKERKQTRSEKRQIETAEANTAYRRTLHKTAEDEHKLTEAETIKLRAEVAQLEKEKKDRGFINKPDYVKDTQLEVATQKLATSEKSLETASTKLAKAANRLEKNRQEEASIREDIKNKTSDKGGREAYGKALQEKTFIGIPRAPYDWSTVAGSARREAAKKILYEKPDKDKLVDLLKKMNKEDEDEVAGKEGKDKEEKGKEPKPEAPKS